MSSEQRRDEIVRATLPLLIEHGANISTRRIARAADVAEGTVFRVFADKDELLRACVSEAFRADDVCARIRAIPTDRDVEARLTEAALLVLAQWTRLGELRRNLASSDHDIHRRDPGSTERSAREGGERFMRELTDAITALLAGEEQRFRMPLAEIVRLFLGLLMSTKFDPHAREDERAAIARRIDVLLHGALAG